jgi:UDP-N-acetylglucosamine acyltransferase
MTNKIHPKAIVDPGAQLGANVEIGPYSIVGAHVKLGDGVKLLSHAVVEGHTTVGPKTVIYPFASIGHKPQDLKFKGEKSTLEIGANCQIREHVTMNPGTEGGGMVTRVGDNCLIMVASHVAHDCIIGNNVILANNATLAGHVTVGDYAIIGGVAAVQQFVRIGAHAMIGGMSGVENDVIPYGMVKGERAHLAGLNLIGMERRGFKAEDVRALRSAYRMLFSPEGTMAERLEEVARLYGKEEHIASVVDFIRTRAGRPLCRPQDTEDAGAA